MSRVPKDSMVQVKGFVRRPGSNSVLQVQIDQAAVRQLRGADPKLPFTAVEKVFESSAGTFTALPPDPALATASACFDWMVDVVIPSRSIEQSLGIPIH